MKKKKKKVKFWKVINKILKKKKKKLIPVNYLKSFGCKERFYYPLFCYFDKVLISYYFS